MLIGLTVMINTLGVLGLTAGMFYTFTVVAFNAAVISVATVAVSNYLVKTIYTT